MLELTIGSADSFVVELFDDQGIGEDLTLSDGARLIIKDGYSATTNILSLATGTDLVISIPDHTLIGTISQPKADALLPGIYICECAVRFGSVWRHTIPFYVKIQPQLAPNSLT